MKIICVEEHATDPATDTAAQPAVLGEAPYFGLMDSPRVASRPRNDHRPTMVALPEALELAADIGDGRIKHMDGQGIHMQVVSYGSLAQLAPADQAADLTQAANNRLAEAIAVNPARLSGFAVLPWQDPQAAAAELDRSVTRLGLKGVLLMGRPGATFLDDPRYAPVLGKLNDLNVPPNLYPYLTLDGTRELLGKLPVSEQDREKISYLNAENCSPCEARFRITQAAGPARDVHRAGHDLAGRHYREHRPAVHPARVARVIR